MFLKNAKIMTQLYPIAKYWEVGWWNYLTTQQLNPTLIWLNIAQPWDQTSLDLMGADDTDRKSVV